MDNPQKELQNKFMIIENFRKIKGMGDNIKRLVYDQYQKGELQLLTLEKKEKCIQKEDIDRIKKIPQISPFFERV